MTDNKRYKYLGREVSKEEVIKELGDPATWSEDSKKIEQEFDREYIETEASIASAYGCPPLMKTSSLLSGLEILETAGSNRIAALKELQSILRENGTELNVVQLSNKLKSIPWVVLDCVSTNSAMAYKKRLEALGVTCKLLPYENFG